jgi:hypothetical protein
MAPLVMGAVGRDQQQKGLDPSGLAEFLGQPRAHLYTVRASEVGAPPAQKALKDAAHIQREPSRKQRTYELVQHLRR